MSAASKCASRRSAARAATERFTSGHRERLFRIPKRSFRAEPYTRCCASLVFRKATWDKRRKNAKFRLSGKSKTRSARALYGDVSRSSGSDHEREESSGCPFTGGRLPGG